MKVGLTKDVTSFIISERLQDGIKKLYKKDKKYDYAQELTEAYEKQGASPR